MAMLHVYHPWNMQCLDKHFKAGERSYIQYNATGAHFKACRCVLPWHLDISHEINPQKKFFFMACVLLTLRVGCEWQEARQHINARHKLPQPPVPVEAPHRLSVVLSWASVKTKQCIAQHEDSSGTHGRHACKEVVEEFSGAVACAPYGAHPSMHIFSMQA